MNLKHLATIHTFHAITAFQSNFVEMFQYTVNDFPIDLRVEGTVASGPDICLAEVEDDLTKGRPWHSTGYCVSDCLTSEEFSALSRGIETILREKVERATGNRITKFRLQDYHKYCTDQFSHTQVLNSMKYCLPLEILPVDWRLIDDRISDICAVRVTVNQRKKIASSRFCLRIVRPGSYTDFNPPHKDGWIDRLKNALNVYLPVAGSNDSSSLPVLPGSHLWSEKQIFRTIEGAFINGIKYTVPCAVSQVPGLRLIRPRVDPGQVLVFSPYLLHGGAINLNSNQTRISLEMRFWRKDEKQ